MGQMIDKLHTQALTGDEWSTRMSNAIRVAMLCPDMDHNQPSTSSHLNCMCSGSANCVTRGNLIRTWSNVDVLVLLSLAMLSPDMDRNHAIDVLPLELQALWFWSM